MCGDLGHGPYVDPAGRRTLFRDYAQQWDRPGAPTDDVAGEMDTRGAVLDFARQAVLGVTLLDDDWVLTAG